MHKTSVHLLNENFLHESMLTELLSDKIEKKKKFVFEKFNGIQI